MRPYRLQIQHLAYEIRILESDRSDLGDIRLEEATTEVDAVVIEGERPVVKVEQGRLSYDLERLTEGQAVNNAYEALTRLPGVAEQEGALTLAGASSVTVILNGRPSTMTAEQLATLLRSTPIDRIEKAEVMFSAPPQYHVRGAAINVVLRRSHETASLGRSPRQLHEPLVRHLRCRRELRPHVSQMVGRRNLLGRPEQGAVEFRPALAAHLRGAAVRHPAG